MSNLTGQAGELRMSIEITRKETGKVETYELVGTATKEQAEELGIETGDEPKED